MRFLDRLPGRDAGDRAGDAACRCRTRTAADSRSGVTDATALLVDADACDGSDIARDEACRATVIDALVDADADTVRVRSDGRDRVYAGRSAALLLAAGRFADAVAVRDPDLAERVRTDPVAVARTALGRAGPVARLVAETGLAACVEGVGDDPAGVSGPDLTDILRPGVAPVIALGRTVPRPPPDATLRNTTDLSTGGTVAVYDRDGPLPHYHLRPVTDGLDVSALATLEAARDRLANGTVESGDRAAGRAVRRAVAASRAETGRAETEEDAHAGPGNDPVPIETLADVLDRHTRGLGVLDDVFADPRVTDASLSPPAADSPLRVVVDGEAMTANVELSAGELAALSSRVRAESGRAFSRASPTTDAALGDVRVAAVTDPASDGPGFAFRRRDDEPWTLPRLVAVGSVPPAVAGLLSVAVERGAAVLVAGPRGAGKTTLLGAMCYELPPATRSVVVEDTPELPLEALREAGRDVQGLRVGTDADAPLSPTEAVRTALRLGEGAIVVGEVRGEEARALYEAMRVGAAADAVLGTIHGTGGASVRERVVSDLGVPPSSFAATDLVVTLGPDRRLAAVEEVRDGGPDGFAALADRETGDATMTGLLDRGESALAADLGGPDGDYADVRAAVRERTEVISDLAAAGRTDAAAVADGYNGYDGYDGYDGVRR
ncbi:Flp pilus assembly complex ATPase component TadA [Halobaculum sp. CBA1158]|uniref:ATPase, T2SS/T4P/T4SS family n=1 Tax=Halobaculum sp. CBA1158 TaxID=2904243 RepID=UPI001F3FB168|nr:ATPase, T2SS/T4P/T4SS family [Halobaculum sp. CBA1158]UIP01158.1 Flp pilus assembly complex ATPase component TadA [Halobaculum sp. CBA1158]